MDDTTPQPSGQTEPAPMRARQRAPKSADAKVRGLAARKFQRQMDQLKASKDVRKLEEATAALAKLNGADEGRPAEPPREEKPEQAAAEDKTELTAVPAHVDNAKKGWPTDAALADAAPTVKELVDVAAVFLAGSRFDILRTISVRVGDKVLERTKAEVLAEKLTPLAAKYGMTLLDSPEALAVAGLVTVFGQPLLELALEKKLGAAVQAVPTGGA